MQIEVQGSDKNKDILLNKINGKWFWKSYQNLDSLLKQIANDVCVKIGRIPDVKCYVFLCNDTEPIQRKYYGKVVHKNVPAFASLSRNVIVINVDRCNTKILKHEFGHIFFESFLGKRVGYHLHEHVAKYCEK